ERDVGEILSQVQQHDLLKFGIIPELVGRLPVSVALDNLDRDALIRILTEPKSAIIKQYVRLMELDDVKLTFEKDAVAAIADKAIARKTGARGLRSILEEILTDVMFRVPSDETIREVIITKSTVEKKGEPLVVHDEHHGYKKRSYDNKNSGA
ncbi:MAG: ATP-dependent Clp protease ATP-binding subunit ClpX, partial [Lachnospiraceae bacterium]|nr:ATP-dependent Clp protease ATP-binding subunit ClpX [Lachnospiraceae bacterium]